ncbi:unnamed protein product [Phytophthora lilii]|uniref:Unnamed protein product n=1 Tax=Phytophthora lilii TaxID=2077276 RepID=A0A9W6XF21_9STRA|nr:unnamed protein product [Phytophthora lilii]
MLSPKKKQQVGDPHAIWRLQRRQSGTQPENRESKTLGYDRVQDASLRVESAPSSRQTASTAAALVQSPAPPEKNSFLGSTCPVDIVARSSIFHEANKNQPLELSSKRTVGRFRQVVEVKKRRALDPRFEAQSGRLNEDLFAKSYAFLDDYKQRELQEPKQQLKKTKRVTRKEELKVSWLRLADCPSSWPRSARKTPARTTDGCLRSGNRRLCLLLQAVGSVGFAARGTSSGLAISTIDKRHLVLMHEQSGQELLPSVVNEQRGSSDSKPAIARAGSARAGSITVLERRLSRGVSGHLPRRKSRPNSGGSHRRASNVSLKSVSELAEEEKPSSPTVLRLRALAHAVRARHSLGIQKPAQRRYLLQASEADTDETDVGVDLLMAGIQTKLKEDAASGYLNKNKIASNNTHDTNSDQRNLSIGSCKVRFTKDEHSTENTANRNTPASSSNGKPPLRSSFKSATMKRGSLTKAPVPLQRVKTIRGDLSAFMNPYEPKIREPEVNLSHAQNLGARITCAHSLYKLSCQVGSELAIIGGGAIAQIADFSDVEDSKLLRYSAAVLANVTTDLSVLEDFASKEGVSALLELSWTPLMDVKVASDVDAYSAARASPATGGELYCKSRILWARISGSRFCRRSTGCPKSSTQASTVDISSPARKTGARNALSLCDKCSRAQMNCRKCADRTSGNGNATPSAAATSSASRFRNLRSLRATSVL